MIVMEAFFFRDRHGKDIMNIPCLCNPVVLLLVRLLRLLHMFKEVSESDSQSEGDYSGREHLLLYFPQR